ncbi:MAG: hypothetical protein ACI9OJ_005076, partial [Myxococcota bacterium]
MRCQVKGIARYENFRPITQFPGDTVMSSVISNQRLSALLLCALAATACTNAEATERATVDSAPAASESTPALQAPAATLASAQTVTVFKTPSCGCCAEWVEHMRDEGFTVEVNDSNSLADVKRRAGVPEDLHSCHTAIVEGLVIEGHVPAATVKQVLADRQGLKGIAVPGMPSGSPGL